MINIETEIKTDGYELYLGDCLEVMDKLIEQNIKVDMILTDPPYGTTACKWDSIIPFNRHIEIKNNHGKKQIMYENDYILQQFKTTNKSYQYILDKFNEQAKDGMWERLNKLIKVNGAIVLFGSEPFSSALRMSNIKEYKYDWVWDKKKGGNPLLSKIQPIKVTENVLIFNSKMYYPIMLDRDKPKLRGKNKGSISDTTGNAFTENKIYTQKYPKNIIEISNANQKGKVHPTQKPVPLMEYLIKTYTLENEVILDFTMGSGSTGVACMNTNRKFIGIEKEEKYFDISIDRIKQAENNIK